MFFVLFLVGAILLSTWLHYLREARAVAAWPTVPGVITLSARSADPESQSKVAYTYSVAGATFTSTRLKLGDWMGYTLFSPDAQAVKYPIGAPVLVRHAPARPSEAVIEPGVAIGATSIGIAGLVFVLVGTAPLWLRLLAFLAT